MNTGRPVGGTAALVDGTFVVVPEGEHALMAGFPLPHDEVRLHVTVNGAFTIVVAGVRAVKTHGDVRDVGDACSGHRPRQDTGAGQSIVSHTNVIVRGFLRTGLVRSSVGSDGLLGHHSHDGPVNDGCAAFAVLGVNDDIAFEAVLAVAVGRMVLVRCFGEGNDGPCRLVMDEDEVACIDATDLTGLVVNHGL